MNAPSFCSLCGSPLSEGDHDACRRQLALEPGRFCPECGRRMKVQVTLRGWTADCVEHGRRHG